MGQLIHPNQIHFSIWFGASVICQSICDSEGTSRPRGISCKSNESISSPATPQTLARKKSETSSPYVELMIFFFLMYRKNVLSLRHTVHAEIPSSRTCFLETVFVALLHASRILQNLSGVMYLCPVSCNIFYTFPSIFSAFFPAFG